MAYTIISQNNTTTTLSDENGNVITVPARVTLATSTDYTIKKVNNNSVDLESGDGKIIRGVPACVVLAGGGGGGDQHNLGYYATQAALEEAYPTAEAGDWAIVGATDTVWIWDEDTSAWVDSDQKGQVTSVNNQTGAVVLGAQDVGAVPQYSSMPTASEDELGNICQFTGTTDANYTNGYFYKCVSDGGNPATYSWSQVSVQPAPSGLPDQTGQSGKFLTTDGTDASWGDLVVDSSMRSIVVGETQKNAPTSSVGNVVIGYRPLRSEWLSFNSYCVCVGDGAFSEGQYAVAIGADSGCGDIGGVAVGYNAATTAAYAIQLGYYKTNSDANTFKVGNANGNYEIMSADGTVPTARLTKVNTTATLAVADWSSSTQTVTVSGVKADSVVFVSPDPTSASDYASAGILCTAQAADSLTFTCTTTPTNAITVNVVCF